MANASAGSIFVDLLLNDAKYTQGLNRATNSTNKAASSWKKDVDRTKESFAGMISPVNALGPAVTRLAGIFAGAFSIQQIISYSDQYKGLNSRLALVTGSAEELATTQERLFQIAQNTAQPLAATVDAYTRLSGSLNSTQRAQTDLIRLTDLLSKTLVISGADATAAATFYQQFGQAASSDFKAVGQELQTFADQNPRLYSILKNEASKYGKTLKQMASDGELSFKFVADAVMQQADIIDQQSSQVALTVGRSFTELNNSILKLIGNSDALKISSGLLAEGIEDLAHWLDELNESGVSVKSTFVGIGTLFLDLAKDFKEYQAANAEKFNFFGLNDERVAKLKAEAEAYQKTIDQIGESLLADKELKDQIAKGSNTAVRAPEVKAPPLIDEKAEKAAEKARKALDALYDKNETYITGATKDQIKYNEAVEELTQLLDAGAITNSDYAAGLDRIQKEYDKAADKGNVFSFSVEEAGKQAARNIQDAFADFLFDPFADGLDGMLVGFLNVIRKMAAEALAANILGGLFGKSGFDLGGIIGKIGGAFAGADVASASTSAGADAFLSDYYDGLFADGGFIKPGHFGIAGEAGAELIFGGPSGATVIPQSGMSSGGKTTVNIINNAGANISQSERQTENGVTLDVLIDRAVSKKIADRSSLTNKAITDNANRTLVKR